jgi:hypothetical protein
MVDRIMITDTSTEIGSHLIGVRTNWTHDPLLVTKGPVCWRKRTYGTLFVES